jgi:DegV family protein with EDD domain
MSQHTNRIALITDSTCDIPPELLEQYGIITVPLYVVWGEESLRDGVDIDKPTFYARLPEDPIHPKTSQPTPADFATVLHECGAQEAVIIVISAELSGTLDSANTARAMVDIPLHVADSFSTSMGLGWQVLAAARVREEGGDAAAMLAAAERVRDTLSVLFTVDTLEYLHKGGRIGGAARLLGTALQLKPMLILDQTTGGIDALERTRTRKKALRRIVEETFARVDPGKPLRVSVIHATARDEAQVMLEAIKAQYNPVDTVFSEISPVLGVHTGPGAIGLIAYNE